MDIIAYVMQEQHISRKEAVQLTDKIVQCIAQKMNHTIKYTRTVVHNPKFVEYLLEGIPDLPSDVLYHELLPRLTALGDIVNFCSMNKSALKFCLKDKKLGPRVAGHFKLMHFIDIVSDLINGDSLSHNVSLTPEFVKQYLDWDWDWSALSRNPNMTPQFIQTHQNWNWDWNTVLRNPSITPEFVEWMIKTKKFNSQRHINELMKLARKRKYNYRNIEDHIGSLYKNPGIDLEFIMDMFGVNEFRWHDASHSPSLTTPFLEKYINTWYQVGSYHPAVTLAVVESRPELVNYMDLSRNPSLTLEFIEANIDKNWYWLELSANPTVTPQLLEKHLNDPRWKWNWVGLSRNPSMTPEFIENHPDYPWDWKWISQNPSLTTQFIDHHIGEPWNFAILAKHPSVTLELVEKHLNLPWWDWNNYMDGLGLSDNPNVTPQFIMKHRDRAWDSRTLSMNPFYVVSKKQ